MPSARLASVLVVALAALCSGQNVSRGLVRHFAFGTASGWSDSEGRAALVVNDGARASVVGSCGSGGCAQFASGGSASTSSGVGTGSVPHAVSMWVKPLEAPSKRFWPMLLGEAAPGNVHWLLYPGGGSQLGVYDYFASFQYSTPDSAAGVVPLDSWTHIATSFDGSRMDVWVDGVLAASVQNAQRPLSLKSSVLHISPLGIASSYSPYVGMVDELRVYDRALSGAEVQQLYRLDKDAFCADSASCPRCASLTNQTQCTSSQRQCSWCGSFCADRGNCPKCSVSTAPEPGVLASFWSFWDWDDSVSHTGLVRSSSAKLSGSGAVDFVGTAYGGGVKGLVPFEGKTPTTVMMWAKVDPVPQSTNWLLRLGALQSGALFWTVDSNHLTVGAMNGPSVRVRGVFQPGVWAHVATVYDTGLSGSLRVYVNGVPAAKISAVQVFTTEKEMALATANGEEAGITGSVSDLRVYNSVMSDADVATLYGRTCWSHRMPCDSFVTTSDCGLSTSNCTWCPFFTVGCRMTDHDISPATPCVRDVLSQRSWPMLLGEAVSGNVHWLLYPNGIAQLGVYSYFSASLAPSRLSPSGAAPTNYWTHIATAFDGIKMEVWIDGFLSATVQNSQKPLSLTSSLIRISPLGLASVSSPYVGMVDELRVYDRALSGIEVQQLYRLDRDAFCADSASCPRCASLTNQTQCTSSQRQCSWCGSFCADRGNCPKCSVSTAPEPGTLSIHWDFSAWKDAVSQASLTASSTATLSGSGAVDLVGTASGGGVQGLVPFEGKTPTTVMMWAKVDPVPQSTNWLLCLGAPQSGAPFWTVDSSGLNIGVVNGPSARVKQAFQSGVWTHVAAVYDVRQAGSLKVYVNGELEVQVSAFTQTITGKAVALATASGTELGVTGSISDLRVYNSAMTDADIRTLYGRTCWSHRMQCEGFATETDCRVSTSNCTWCPFFGGCRNTEAQCPQVCPRGTTDHDLVRATPCVSCQNISRGLVRHFAFGTASGWWDSQNRGEVVISDGALVTLNTTCGSGGCARFASGGSANITSGLATGTIPHTVSMWIKQTEEPAVQRSWPMLLGDATPGNVHWLLYTGGHAQLGVYNHFSAHLYSSMYMPSGPVPVGYWTHVVTAFDGARMTVWIDGALQATIQNSAKQLSLTSPVIHVSPGGVKTGDAFVGMVDELRVYDRALSGAEVQKLYELDRDAFCADSASCPRCASLTNQTQCTSSQRQCSWCGTYCAEVGNCPLCYVSSDPEPSRTALASYWDFNSWKDLIGLGSLTVSASAKLSGTGHVDFVGAANGGGVQGAVTFEGSASATVMMWVRIAVPSKTTSWLLRLGNLADSAPVWTTDEEHLTIGTLNGPSANLWKLLRPGVWTHLATVYDASADGKLTVHVNGEPAPQTSSQELGGASAAAAIPTARWIRKNHSDLWLMLATYSETITGKLLSLATASGEETGITGSVGDLRVYNSAVSESDVRTIFGRTCWNHRMQCDNFVTEADCKVSSSNCTWCPFFGGCRNTVAQCPQVCPRGMTDDDIDSATPCVRCPPNTFSRRGNRGECTPCPQGTYDHDNSPATPCVPELSQEIMRFLARPSDPDGIYL
eukprot:m51a1_g4943 hypothetical protein (1590) ;mRNA; f:311589-319521